MENSYQSLGSVARPSVDDNGTSKQIVVYMGSSDPNTKVDIVFLQNYGLPTSYMSKVYTISPGRTEITIPSIISADVEKGGQVMARVTQGSTSANVQIRLSEVTDIPHLNVNNIINDSTKEEEVKDKIRAYINELKIYISDIKSLYPTEVSDKDKINNIYLYDKETSPLNTTDIEGDRFTLTLPASEILRGIEEGLENDIEAQVERVHNALLAWEQEVQVGFAKKGVFEEIKDFNGNGEIDSEDREYFKKHRAPLTRLNIKYQRMMMGAAAYASSHHIGVGFNSALYIQGVPYKIDSMGNVVNKDEAHLYGGLIGHEMGHCMDIADRLYPETSNNLMAAITGTMLDEDSPYASSMNELYKKVTSNTIGLATNRSVVVNMLWQPYLAYENESTYKMLLTDGDADLSNDSFFAKLNRACREMTAEEKANGDRDQWLIRMNSKVAGKDLTDFYEAHGIVANETTLQYVSQFPKETKKIQYINDEARRRRMAGTADMEEGTILSAKFGNDSRGNEIVNGSYVNDKNVSINLYVDKSNDNILGYEIYRNGKPAGFIERNKNGQETVYTDVVDNINNRVVTYSAVAYDYNLNPTATIFFDQEGVTGGNQLSSYNARYVKITALETKNISIAELEVITPPGDNIEIGVAEDNINYENGIGILKEKFVYVADNPETEKNEEKSIPAGSIVIIGEYRGNPAFNVPLVLNQNEEHIADKYNGILMAEIHDNGDLQEISEGNWVYWVEPEYVNDFMKDNTEIFAELYRTDSADALTGGQRLVSDTFKIKVPDELPEIKLSSGNEKRTNNIKTFNIKEDVINKVIEAR